MKRFLSAVGLCVFLLVFGLFFLYPRAEAQNNILPTLLNLPAPPPPNPFIERSYKVRSEDFYKKKDPPSDNAPIEDLLDYWQRQSTSYVELGYNIKPSEKVLERIIAEIEKNHDQLPNFLNILPETDDATAFVKRLYDEKASQKDSGTEEYNWSDEAKNWLTFHSKYFSDELLKTAEQVTDTDEYVSNQAELLALTRVDWEKAQPVLNRLTVDRDKPVSKVLASWAFYRHALDTNSIGDIDKYRDELKAVVENKAALPGMRDLALDALFKEKDWPGRDDWYMTLLSDETLTELKVNGQVYTGLTTIMYYAPPEKYADKMLELLKSDNKTIRSAAVRNLVKLLGENDEKIIRALLPWLENKNWAKESSAERQSLVAALQNLTIPESVPGLIAALNEKETREVSNTAETGANTAITANSTKLVDYYPLRDSAILALDKQKDPRAASALRSILPEVEDWQRGTVVKALLMSQGFSIAEQVDALEAVAIANLNEANAASNTGANINPPVSVNVASNTTIPAQTPYNPSDIKILLGGQLAGVADPDEALVMALADRISVLDRKNPALASALRLIMQNWTGASINTILLKDLRNNQTTVETIVKLLSIRKELREKQLSQIYDLRSGSPIAIGIAACLLEDDGEYNSILAGDNVETKTAMLGCARLLRARLPVQSVAENLKNQNKLLALAAERYLESEDSDTSRAIVLSLHPNEAKILGASAYFGAGDAPIERVNFLSELFASVNESLPAELYYYVEDDYGAVTAAEKKLRKEVRENQELLGVYAYDSNFIRIYNDKAVFSWEEDAARYRERVLTGQEFDYFKNYLITERVDDLPPFLAACEGGEEGCEGKELLMLGRQGGRRIFLMGGKKPKFFDGLDSLFSEMRKQPAKLHYWLEKNMAGLDILFENENLQARAVWKNGSDFRVLIEDQARRKQIDNELQKQEESVQVNENTDYEKLAETNRKRREQREFENFAWYKMEQTGFAGITGQPAQAAFIPLRDQSAVQASAQQWKAKTANFEIRAGDDALYKFSRGQLTKFLDGYYISPLATPNGRWVIASKYNEAGENILVRINLLTNKETQVKLDQAPTFEALSFIPSLNKVLIFAGTNSEYQGEGEGEGESVVTEPYNSQPERVGDYFLLDAETGAVQPVKGEIRPLVQQTFRPLQPAVNADEFWAAIPNEEKNETQVGTYNAKTLSFKSILKIPQIQFDSMNTWIDADKIYFVYQGHLLSLPLANQQKQP